MSEIQHPLHYQRPVSTFWWLRRRAYLIFALRELSCLGVAWFVVFLLLLVNSINAGKDQYLHFLALSAHPWMLLLNLTSLLLVVLHAITWFKQMPQALVVRLRGRRLPRPCIAVSMYLMWAVLSAMTTWIVLGR
jgi:fumarate reductase subunit C